MNNNNDFPELTQEDELNNKICESAKALQYIKHTIAEWLVRKEEEENKLQQLLGHDKSYEGRESYECGKYIIRITTGWNWSFDKKEYELMKDHIPRCFNPVVQKMKYELDKDILKDIEAYSSGDERKLLDTIFSKKEKKMNVIVETKKS